MSVAAVAAVSGVIEALRSVAPVLSLGVLYVFAVVPIALAFGLAWALVVSVASMLAFNFFFLPPLHTLGLRDSRNWVALAVYLTSGVVVSELAARARRRAAEAEQREQEAAALADVSALLLEGEGVQSRLRGIGAHLAEVLGSPWARIELGSLRQPEAHESAHELRAGDRFVGRLFLPAGVEVGSGGKQRLLPALASLLAVATERERLARQALEAEALRRSDAIKTAVLRSVSHDLRSPLTAIRAASEGLQSASISLDPADEEALVETIQLETRRLERLVANLLDLSRLEVGAARPRPELWTADTLFSSALEHLGADAARVAVTLPADIPPVRVDAAQIERVLVNLLENALKFSPPDAPVELRAASTPPEVAFLVVDRGPGLDADDLERVFEPFERSGASTGRQGAGLGLAIARGFAQANGARLTVESSPGQGSTFVLTLAAAGRPVGTLA